MKSALSTWWKDLRHWIHATRGGAWLGGVLTLVLVGSAIYANGDFLEWVETLRERSNEGATILAVSTAMGVALAMPATPFFLLAGAAFGTFYGGLVGFLGLSMGSLVQFALARRAAPMMERPPKWLPMLQHRQGLVLGFLRATPWVPAAALNFGAGFLRVRWSTFLRTLPLALFSSLALAAAGSTGSRYIGDGAGTPFLLSALLIAATTITSAIVLGRLYRESGKPVRTLAVLERTGATLVPRRNEQRVGVELEVLNVDIATACEAVQEVLSGEASRDREGTMIVRTELGDFRIERDAEAFRQAKALRTPERDLKDHFVLKVAAPWVPTEIVSPPLPISQIGVMDKISNSLVKRNAKGTETSWAGPLGLHLNPEAKDTSPESILATLRAFFLLRGWMRDDADIALKRRLSPYIAPHPREYVELVMNRDYSPDLERLIRDYIKMTPSRNRDLDMLPLFAELRPDLVRPLEDERIKARPTYHYRLPNASIGDPDWSVSAEWERWQMIERLASDKLRLGLWLKAYRTHHRLLDGPWRHAADRRIA